MEAEKIKNKKGQFIYPSTCGGYSNRHYKRLSTALVSVYSASKKICGDKGLPVYKGHKQSKEFAGTSASNCSGGSYGSSKTYGSAYGSSSTYGTSYGANTYGSAYGSEKTSSSSNSYVYCSGSQALYNNTIDMHYQCSDKANIEDSCGSDLKLCNNIGLYEYENGNLDWSKRLLKKACDGGLSYGCGSLGEVEYMEGNTKKARTLFTKSCDMGEEYSSCNFVDALNGYEDSILELVNIYKYTCEVGEVLYACNMLSKFKNSNDPKIKKIAKQQSCKSKNFKDCFDLGNIEYNRGNIGLAIKYYKKSCIGEYMKGCVNLGSIEYNRGRLANARRYYSKACDNNENIACTKLFDINNRVPSGSKK